VDEDSIDWQLATAGGQGTLRSPRLDLQLKCTARPKFTNRHLRFTLPAASLRGLASRENEFSVSVDIPMFQRFDVTALRAMMNRIRAGELP